MTLVPPLNGNYRYRVVRVIREVYEVESRTPLSEDEVRGQANDPATVTVESETIQQVAP